VQQLKAFKSGTAHQQVVFACMVHNLFDEYRFFPNYPDLELDTTAALFGALLHHQLLTNITLGMALRHVLQALGAPPSSKMFRFGLGAIRQFQPELNLWPKFCEHALAIPHLKAADPALWALMEKVVAAAGPSSGSSSSGGAADAGDLTSSGGGPSPAATAAAAGSGAAAGGAAAAAAAASSSVPNGTSSGSTGGSNPGKGAEQQPAQQPGARGGAAGGAAAAGRLGAAAGRDGAANGPQQQQGGKAAAGAAGGKGGAGGAAGGSVGSVDTADNLRDLMNNAGVAQAAATMALNDKPERMTLNMTLNNETLDTAERKLSSAVAPGDTLTDKVGLFEGVGGCWMTVCGCTSLGSRSLRGDTVWLLQAAGVQAAPGRCPCA
jgi:CCR4-NOT transcription complex subunit 1